MPDAWVYQELLDTTLLVTGAGQDEAGEVYLTACECDFERDYDPFDNPTGTLWRVVAADQVPEGAETAPLEATGRARSNTRAGRGRDGRNPCRRTIRPGGLGAELAPGLGNFVAKHRKRRVSASQPLDVITCESIRPQADLVIELRTTSRTDAGI